MTIDKKSVIWCVAGVAVGALAMYILNKKGVFHNATGMSELTMGRGDKGSDVLDLQRNMNLFFQLNGSVPESGTFDKETAGAARMMFEGTHALINPNKGTLNRNFVDDFNMLINREKQQ